MIKLDAKTMTKLRKNQMECLIEVDRICKKCDIKYNIFAGTLLGAVRHGGYIPWDDDADVAFLREEYEKFREVIETELDTTRFYFQDQRKTEGYRWGYGKIRRKNTLFLRENQSHMKYEQGVFIDIFPIDGVPDQYLQRSIHNLYCNCIRKILWSEVGRVADKSFFMRGIYSLLARIPERSIKKIFNDFIIESNKEKTRMVRMLTFPAVNNEYGFLRRWFEQSAEYQFEGYIFKGIKDYDSYLTFTYGDYMKLPPVSQRKTHPVSEIKLTDSILPKGVFEKYD